MMNKIKKLVKKEMIPFIVLFFIFFILTITKNIHYRDDLYFADFTSRTGEVRLLGFLNFRYKEWTSRLIIETVLVLLARNFPWLWRISEPIVYCILAYGIYRIFIDKKSQKKLIMSKIVVCFMILIPQAIFNTAGWMATSLNYLWPTAFGIIALIPIKKCIDNEKLRWYEYPIYICSCIFAANAEQVSVVLFMVYLLFTIYFIIKKKINPFIIILLILSILSLVFIITCPGNPERTIVCVREFYYDYNMLNIIDKLLISVSLLMRYYIFTLNPIYVVFTVIMMIKIYRKYDNIFYRIIATFPVWFGVAFNVLLGTTEKIFPELCNCFAIYNSEEWKLYLNFQNFDNIMSYVPIFLIIVNTGILLIETYLIFGIKPKGIIAILVLCAGICSKLMMGIVCVAYTSDTRTHLLFMLTMIILSIMMLEDEEEMDLKKVLNVFLIMSLLIGINDFCINISIK